MDECYPVAVVAEALFCRPNGTFVCIYADKPAAGGEPFCYLQRMTAAAKRTVDLYAGRFYIKYIYAFSEHNGVM